MKKADALAVFFLYAFLYAAFGYAAGAFKADALTLQCAFTLSTGALPFLYAALRRIPFSSFFRAGNFSFSLLAGGLLCMAGGMALSGAAQALFSFFASPPPSASAKTLETLFLSYPRPLVFAVSTVLPSVCEETLFRGFILSALRSSPQAAYSGFRREAPAVFACALLFASAHMDGARFLSAFVSGAVISYAACAAGSLALPMLMHFFNNSATFLLYFAASDTLRGKGAGYFFAAGNAAAGTEMAARLSEMLPHLPAVLLFAAAVSLFLIFAGAKVIRHSVAS